MTSEVGRALIGLVVLQLSIKSIEPNQSIRLHKGYSSRTKFSWKEGVPMRSLDTKYNTPILRQHGLLKLNKYGVFMTRTLAENYPYSTVYKAGIRGGRVEWATLIERIEAGETEPEPALHYLLSKLLHKAEEFNALANDILDLLDSLMDTGLMSSKESIHNILLRHIDESDYAARIMEIAMHSLMQARQECDTLGSSVLIPLSQMRSANKKHGNIGDVELMDAGQIIEAWDAKYGKSYLRDELEELHDKLANHSNVVRVGFVTSTEPERLEELDARRKDIEEANGIDLKIMTLEEWVSAQFDQSKQSSISEKELAQRWIKAYVESLAQRRTEMAPIDEPCYQWLEVLKSIFQSLKK